MTHARRSLAAAAACLLAVEVRAADSWDLEESYAGVAVAEAYWTIDEAFPGTKIILEGRHSLSRRQGDPRERPCACEPSPPAQKMIGTIGAHLQWGKGETGLEYGVLTFTGLASQRNFTSLEEGGVRVLRETLEWGVVRTGKDDPLGIDSYVELSVARGSRTWAFSSVASPWRFTFSINGSAGFAWADSSDETYRDVSNMTIGTWGQGTVNRGRWGTFYVEQRVVNGWTFSSPSAGGTVSREARARAGYVNRLRGCLSIEIFGEKRSFNFTDPRLLDLYTKSKRVGVEISCRLNGTARAN